MLLTIVIPPLEILIFADLRVTPLKYCIYSSGGEVVRAVECEILPLNPAHINFHFPAENTKIVRN